MMADTEDTETLIAELSRFRKSGVGLSPVGAKTAASAVLASSWLLARDERIRADEREKLAAVETLADEWRAGLPVERTEIEPHTRLADLAALDAALHPERQAGEVEAQ